MRIYEIDGVDIGRLMEESIKLGNSELKETTSENVEYVKSFIDAIRAYDITQLNLLRDSWYYPIGIVDRSAQQLIELYLTPDAVKFIAVVGSRLKFETKDNAIVYFPSDTGLSQNGYRFVVATREELDQIVNLAVLKFSNNDWVLRAFAYTTNGKMSPISNL